MGGQQTVEIAGDCIVLAGSILALYGATAWRRGEQYPVPPRIIRIMFVAGALIVMGAAMVTGGHPSFQFSN